MSVNHSLEARVVVLRSMIVAVTSTCTYVKSLHLREKALHLLYEKAKGQNLCLLSGSKLLSFAFQDRGRPVTLCFASFQVGSFFVANIPAWIAWLKYVSFVYYGYNLLLKVGPGPGWPLPFLPRGILRAALAA